MAFLLLSFTRLLIRQLRLDSGFLLLYLPFKRLRRLLLAEPNKAASSLAAVVLTSDVATIPCA